MTSFSVLVFVTALLSSTAPMEPVEACSDRPGTPTNVIAAPLSANDIQLSWTNTASEQVWWDVEITDSAGTVLAQPAGIGRGDEGAGLRISNLFSTPPRTERCFRVKARTARGTEGCVSQVWSNRSCATTPALPVADRPANSAPNRTAHPVKRLGKVRLFATANNDVDIYNGPNGTQFTVIGMLRAGESAEVVRAQEGWHLLKIAAMPGGLGWAASDHLTIAKR